MTSRQTLIGGRPRTRTSVVALTTAVLSSLLLAGSAAATPVRSLHDEVAAGTVHYFDPDFGPDSALDRTDTASFEPGRIEPGEPVTVRVHQTDHIINTDPPGDCAAGPIEPLNSRPHTEWFLDRVDPGKTIYASLPVSNTVHGTGTLQSKQDQFVCYLEVQQILELAIPGEQTALLTPGCYQTSGYNPHIVEEAVATGTIATLVVGDVSCEQVVVGALTLIGEYSYSGMMKGPLVSLFGTDTVRVEGDAASLAQVVSTCVISTWKAYAKAGQSGTLRMFWNGEVAPFGDHGVPIDFELDDDFKVKKDAVTVLTGTHGEIVTITRCDAGTGRSYPALPWGTGLQLAFPQNFVGVHHSLTVTATLTNGLTYQVVVPGSSTKSKANWQESASGTISP